MRYYQVTYYVKKPIFDRNLKLTSRWFRYKRVNYRTKKEATKEISWCIKYDNKHKPLENKCKYTIRCIVKGGKKRV